MSEVSDFDRDAISFVLELADVFGVKPKEAAPRITARMMRRLSELRTQWVSEVETVLSHAMRDRDAHKETVARQAKAISLAAMALDKLTPADTMGDHAKLDQAKKFLREAHEP